MNFQSLVWLSQFLDTSRSICCRVENDRFFDFPAISSRKASRSAIFSRLILGLYKFLLPDQIMSILISGDCLFDYAGDSIASCLRVWQEFGLITTIFVPTPDTQIRMRFKQTESYERSFMLFTTVLE
jgi:hypothetical protein